MPERVNRHDYLTSEKPVESKFAVEQFRKDLTMAKASGLGYAAGTARESREFSRMIRRKVGFRSQAVRLLIFLGGPTYLRKDLANMIL